MPVKRKSGGSKKFPVFTSQLFLMAKTILLQYSPCDLSPHLEGKLVQARACKSPRHSHHPAWHTSGLQSRSHGSLQLGLKNPALQLKSKMDSHSLRIGHRGGHVTLTSGSHKDMVVKTFGGGSRRGPLHTPSANLLIFRILAKAYDTLLAGSLTRS